MLRHFVEWQNGNVNKLAFLIKSPDSAPFFYNLEDKENKAGYTATQVVGGSVGAVINNCLTTQLGRSSNA